MNKKHNNIIKSGSVTDSSSPPPLPPWPPASAVPPLPSWPPVSAHVVAPVMTRSNQKLITDLVDENERLNKLAEQIEKDKRNLREQIEQKNRALSKYDNILYDRIYNHALSWVPDSQKFRWETWLANMVQSKLLSGLTETMILRDLRDTLNQMLRSEPEIVKIHPKKKSKKKKPSTKKKKSIKKSTKKKK
jgi:hypothetical protein